MNKSTKKNINKKRVIRRKNKKTKKLKNLKT